MARRTNLLIETPPLMIKEVGDGGAILVDTMGFVIEGEFVEDLLQKLQKGYSTISDESIREYNSKRGPQGYREEGYPEYEEVLHHRIPKKEVVKKSGYIYLMESAGLYKIGVSKHPERRRADIQTSSGREVFLIASMRSKDCMADERFLHDKFKESRTIGEWFDFSDDTLAEVIGHYKVRS